METFHFMDNTILIYDIKLE